nr:hypothetical protein GCM10020092_026430 [Actinoplanes digitatis]
MDPAAAEKRARQRADRVAAGMAELRRWLDDQVQQGLAGAEQAGRRPYEAMAARLVDAQAPAAASAVRRLGGVAGIGPHWADRLLGELALLRLLVAGHERLGALPPALAATVRSRIGFPVANQDVLATAEVRDLWQVLGQIDSEEGAITTRRTWLLGVGSGRFALLLSFAAPGQSPAAEVVPGTAIEAALCFYPGAAPLRALVKEQFGTPRPLTAPAPAAGLRAALAELVVDAGRRALASRRAGAAGGRGAGRRRVPRRRRRGVPAAGAGAPRAMVAAGRRRRVARDRRGRVVAVGAAAAGRVGRRQLCAGATAGARRRGRARAGAARPTCWRRPSSAPPGGRGHHRGCTSATGS